MFHPQVITKKPEIIAYLKKLGITVDQEKAEHILLAFVHKSFASDYKEEYSHNERLEFLGDGILGAFVNKFLFVDYPNMPESDLTLYKIALVREETLAQAAKDINLGEMVFISHGEERMKGREKFSILSDSFEALIAGIYLDCGAEQSEKFVRKYVYNKIAGIDTTPVKSYKSLVQELIQRDYKVIPDYHDTEYEVSSSGNVETYKSEIFLHNTKKAEGFGLSKKKAQEAAAKNFFEEKKKSEAGKKQENT